MDWLHPQYLWTLLLAPVAAGLYLWSSWKRRNALRALGNPRLVERLAHVVSPRRRRWKGGLAVLGVLFLALALAGPRMGTRLKEVKREGIDLVIALDVSSSMYAQDVSPNRLLRAKNEIKKLLPELEGDRVGLVLFAGDAFLQCPLTTDHSALRLFLDIANDNMIPTPGTDFSAAISMALRALEVPERTADQTEQTRAIVIVSDGENHAPNIDEAIASAREAGVVIFTAGVGETSGTPIPLYRAGQQVGYKKDADGRVVSTRLEEEALRRLATDGAYFRIARTSSSLSQLAAALGRLETMEYATEQFDEYREQYQWPLALALILLLVERFVSDRRRGIAGPLRTSTQTTA
ncbi:MAG TPA: VWA domain-containing protein [Rhodothermales bacterium]